MAPRRGDPIVKIFLPGRVLALAIGSHVGLIQALKQPWEQELSGPKPDERPGAWRQLRHLFSVERLSPKSFNGNAPALAQPIAV